MKRDKAEIQATALGVVVAWLRNESHASEEMGTREMRWACEAQERIAFFVEMEAMKLRMKSKTAKR
jgi:hypothetical protein